MSLTLFLLLIFAYLLGGVPFGLLWGRIFADVDIRQFGSGNIGATNVNRILGRKLGAATLLSDVLKAVLAVGLAKLFLETDFETSLVGLAVVIGHCYPIYLKFNGGKGVASSFGVVLMIAPLTAVVALVVWLLVYRLSRTSALGALVSGVAVPLLSLFEKNWNFPVAACFGFIVLIIFVRHKENISRMRQGGDLKV